MDVTSGNELGQRIADLFGLSGPVARLTIVAEPDKLVVLRIEMGVTPGKTGELMDLLKNHVQYVQREVVLCPSPSAAN